MNWLRDNYQWIFSGIGVTFIGVVWWIFRRFFSPAQPPVVAPTKANVTTGDSSPVAVGNNITQMVTQNIELPVPAQNSSLERRHREWKELIEELPNALDQMASAFSSWREGGIIDVDDESPSPWVAIRRGNTLVHNRLYIAGVFKDSGLLERWNELVHGAEDRDFPRAPGEEGYSPISRFIRKSHTFKSELVRVAREDLNK